MKKQTIYIRPKPNYDWDGYVEWSVNKKKWYPISHIYVGTESELPEPGQSFKTAPNSPLKDQLLDFWSRGATVKVLGEYRRDVKRLVVYEILEDCEEDGKKKRIEQLDTLDKAIILAIGPEGDSKERVKAKAVLIHNILKSLEEREEE